MGLAVGQVEKHLTGQHLLLVQMLLGGVLGAALPVLRLLFVIRLESHGGAVAAVYNLASTLFVFASFDGCSCCRWV
jgi:NhaP-type Na+/H+ or K+/H+ antiporter